MSLSCHSEIGKLHSVCIKKVKEAFINAEHIEKYWKTLNYTDKPDFSLAVTEYEGFESVFTKYGVKLYHLSENDTVNMDSIYCRDAAIATNAGMITCNMGKAARANEPSALQKAFEANNIPILGTITAPGTVEGGDVAWLDEHTLAVGLTYRTNEGGIRQLKSLLASLKVEVITVPLPHYKGPEDVFHLMSILSPVDKHTAVVYSPLMPIGFRNELLRRNYHLVEVPESEFESMGCNVLALAPGVCLIVEGNPKTKTLLEEAGCKVIEYKGNEISVKGGGGPTCLTRPIYREV